MLQTRHGRTDQRTVRTSPRRRRAGAAGVRTAALAARLRCALLALVVAIVAGVLVTFFTIDLGPAAARSARSAKARSTSSGRCTSAGSRRSSRPASSTSTISSSKGSSPTDRPFLKARRDRRSCCRGGPSSRRKLIVESVDMTDWDMVVETWPSSPGFPNGRHNFPKFTRDSKSTGPKRFHDDGAERARVARQRSPTRTTARRGASRRAICASRCHAGVPTRVYRGRGVVHRLDDHDPEVRAVPRDMQSRFTIDGSTAALQPDRSRQRRRAVGAHRRRRHRPLAGADLSDRVDDRFPDAEEHLLSRQTLHGLRPGRLPRDVPPLQGRPRAEGHVHAVRWRA